VQKRQRSVQRGDIFVGGGGATLPRPGAGLFPRNPGKVEERPQVSVQREICCPGVNWAS
jgi:hypothetical protein